jgi:hypothetical protein
MKTLIANVVLGVVAVADLRTAPLADVAAPASRAASVDLASRILSPPTIVPLAGVPSNPFILSASRVTGPEIDPSQAAAEKAAILASTKSLLVALADRLEPKGTFVVGGESIILLGQKKLKLGDKYTINFEGSVYEVEITAIETTRFSVRYKNEEVTRPIAITKSGK